MARREVPLIEEVKSAWQRREIVLAALHPGCATCAAVRRALLSARGPLRGFDVAVLPLELGLRDGEPGTETRAVLGRAGEVDPRSAFVLVADRFLELFAVVDAHPKDLDAFVAELSEWLEAVQRQVCECSRMREDS